MYLYSRDANNDLDDGIELPAALRVVGTKRILALLSNFTDFRWIVAVGCSKSPHFVGMALYQLTHIGSASIISYQVPLLRRIIDTLSHYCSCILTSFEAFLIMWIVEVRKS